VLSNRNNIQDYENSGLNGPESLLLNLGGFAIQANAENTVTFNFTFATGSVIVNWGDGTSSVATSTVNVSKTYGSPFSGQILITGGLSGITNFNGSAGRYSFDIGTLKNYFTNLSSVNFSGSNTTFGSIASLPAGLVTYINTGLNTTSGSIASLPVGLVTYNNTGSNTTSGSIASLPAGLVTYINSGSNTTSGSIASLPVGLVTYNNAGLNTTSGSIALLPAGLVTFVNLGLNTTSGDISLLPANLQTYRNDALNTTTGDIALLPATLTFFRTDAIFSTIFGNLASIPSNITIYITSSSQVDDYTSGRIWANNQNTVQSLTAIGFGLTSTEVDNLLIDLSNVVNWTGARLISIAGNNAARTIASDAAVLILIGKGVTIITN